MNKLQRQSKKGDFFFLAFLSSLLTDFRLTDQRANRCGSTYNTSLLFSARWHRLVRPMQTIPLIHLTSNKLPSLLPDTYNTSLTVSEPEYLVPGGDLPCTRCLEKLM